MTTTAISQNSSIALLKYNYMRKIDIHVNDWSAAVFQHRAETC